MCKYPWDYASAQVALQQDAVHVWCVSLDQPTARSWQLLQTLSVDERLRAERYYFEQDRQRFIVGRGLLRAILGYYLHVEPAHVQFCYGRYGKPSLQCPPNRQGLEFNLTHSHGLALYAITRDRRVGVDIEHIRPVAEIEQIARSVFSSQEYAMLQALPSSELLRGFFNCWTRKEAIVKARGEGLAFTLDQFTVSLRPGAPAQLLSTQSERLASTTWTLLELTPVPGYVAALAVDGLNCRLKTFSFSHPCLSQPSYLCERDRLC